ncbi:MAG: hypothetical protein GY811_26510 [Myxococcales bacterium]|nr:hypothetical protein [Myxococcales bacterium]
MEALRNLGAPHSRVLRHGTQALIEFSLFVPGDIVVIEAGDRLGADQRVVQASQL